MMSKLQELPEKLLVGLSGGADSVALMHMLLEEGAQVSAVHVNHGLRGSESDGDEAFVRQLCEKLGVPLYLYRADPPENPGEGWAREVRYGFFRQAMQASGADALVLAHHRDDQAETLLLHLLRGAGLNGLKGMAFSAQVEGMRVLRPLLSLSRESLRAYLVQKGLPWREDASNADPRFLRNAIRHELLPLMEQLAPGAAARMARTALLLQQDDAVLTDLAAAFLARYPGHAIPLEAIRSQPHGLQSRILRQWWERNAKPDDERSLSVMTTGALWALLDEETAAQCNLPGGWHGRRGWTHLHLVPPEGSEAIPETPAGDCPLLEIAPYTGNHGDGQGCQAIPAAWLKECTVRSRKSGDFIRPFGQAGKQSLQDYLVNRRVDAAFRDRVPLLCHGSEVLLVGGVGAGNIPCIDESKDPVLLKWKDTFPWQRAKK